MGGGLRFAVKFQKMAPKKSAYQVCYDVMVTFDMFPHTDSLERDTERDRMLLLCMHSDKPGAM